MPMLKEMFIMAKTLEVPTDWNARRAGIVESLMRDRFRRHPELREKLMATGNRELINELRVSNEENLYWGVIKQNGQN